MTRSLKASTDLLFSNSFLIFITRFFPAVANLLVIIYYSRQLPIDLYGEYSRFWIQVNISYPLICFGLHALVVTYSRPLLLRLIRGLTPRHYLTFALWAATLGGAFAFLLHSSTEIPFYIPFLFIITFSASVVLEAVLMVCKGYRVLVPVNMLYAVAFCVVHGWVLRTSFSLTSLFVYLLLVNLVRLLVYAAAVFFELRQPIADESSGVLPALSKVRGLWLHLGLYDVLQNLSTWVDKFIVSLVLSAGLSAIYFNGSMNIPFLPVLLSAAGSSVLMQLASLSPDNERSGAIMLMNQTGKILSCIVFPVFFFLLLFSREAVLTLFQAKYRDAIPVFEIALFVLPVRAYSFTTVLQRLHKGSIINAGAIGEMVLAVLLIYPLYQWIGLPGVALSFVISTWLQASFYLFHSAQLLGTSVLQLLPFGNWLLKLIAFGLLFIAVHYFGNLFLTGKFVLFLGLLVMILAIIMSLLIEFRQTRK